MKASDWISVKDELPKIGERVLICTEFSDESQMVFLGFFDNGIEPDLPIGLWNIDDYGHCDTGITHWQPIVLPKKEKQ